MPTDFKKLWTALTGKQRQLNVDNEAGISRLHCLALKTPEEASSRAAMGQRNV